MRNQQQRYPWLVLLLILSMMVLSMDLTAQDQDGGALPNVEIEITNQLKVILPVADRMYVKVPPRASEPVQPAIQYQFKPVSVVTPVFVPQIKPLRLKPTASESGADRYVRAGFGNYRSPLLDLRLHTKGGTSNGLGLKLFHQSFGTGPVDGKNSAAGRTELGLYGHSVGDLLKVDGQLDYANRSAHFYGYPAGSAPEVSSIEQQYKQVSFAGRLSNSKSGDVNFQAGASYSYLWDHYHALETDVQTSLTGNYKIDAGKRIELAANYGLLARKDSLQEAKPRHLLQINPALVFSPLEKLQLRIGAGMALQNDTINQRKAFHLYPDLAAEFRVHDAVTLFASVTGNMDKVSLHSLSGQNIWVAPNISLYHTNRKFDASGGLRLKIGTLGQATLGASYAQLADWYFFLNQPTDVKKFDVIYDQGITKRTNVFGELQLSYRSKTVFSARVDLYQYKTEQQAEAWHRPAYRFRASLQQNVQGKLFFHTDLMAAGGMKAKDALGSVVTLLPALDLNAGVDYHLTSKWSVFLKGNNLLNSAYPVFQNYPVRGIQIQVGATLSF